MCNLSLDLKIQPPGLHAHGHDVANAAQLQRCRSNLGEMGQMMMGPPLTLQTFLTNVMLGKTVGDVLFEDSLPSDAMI
jgi:conjugal transfer mating pair stabilization protein TraG